MNAREIARRCVARPAWGCLVLALLLREGLVLHQWAANPLVRSPVLDGELYAIWASDIAAGDVAGTKGVIGGGPWILNPLYAYALAPVVRVFQDPLLPILLLQGLVGAATSALAAGAASRTFGRTAGWAAGLLTVFAAPLAELDAHLAVAPLAAFLAAGASFACAPPSAGDRKWAHGPLAAGVWLGVGALARPVTLLALPFVAWRFARESPRRVRTAALVAAAFFACAVPTLARNWIVTGEPSLYTVAGGVNVHFGNNADAREFRAMASPWIRMSPVQMHEDARRHVAEVTGTTPTRAEAGAWFTREAFLEVTRHPWESLVHYAHKARWFLGPAEVPSSASLSTDLRFAPGLALAWVPAWLVAALAVAGAWTARRRPEALLGPGAIVLAHAATLTLVFPLSHYRAPALPAMAVLAGGAVAACAAAWRERRRRAAAAIAAVAAGTAVLGALPPQPDPMLSRDEMILGRLAERAGDHDAALRHARAALELFRAQRGRESAMGWERVAELQMAHDDLDGALATLDDAVGRLPGSLSLRCMRSTVRERRGEFAAAVSDAREALARHPGAPAAHARLGEALSLAGASDEEAVRHLRTALDAGVQPDPAALARVGLRR